MIGMFYRKIALDRLPVACGSCPYQGETIIKQAQNTVSRFWSCEVDPRILMFEATCLECEVSRHPDCPLVEAAE